ncbi:ComF family protein [Mobilitalea sibirica]|uniref:ComF family protein n=1 Tax=Mobilitalea sibirica TaxID=1462919 RepID=A0A8J7H4L4_9FIRM|nr:ComF family protein [Mobilitalea sibirica]MBH1942448.1 ComF family protein [Mobilitalea sibirica]
MLYPVRCPICGDIAVSKDQLICNNCSDKLILIKEPRCKKCSKPIDQEEKEFCNDCEQKKHHYIQGYSLWVYEGAIKKSIADYKYHYKKENAVFYIQELLRGYGAIIKKWAPDVIVPVPIHRSKHKERGYNQADILALGIGNELEIPVLSKLLLRNKKTLPQKQLDDKERLHNLKEAFELNPKINNNLNLNIKKVLLVDDIYTTGSTVEACTNVLLKYGVSKVYFITLCIGKGY